MIRWIRLLSLLLAAMLCLSMAAAEPVLFPAVETGSTPVSVTLQADVSVLMPFDDTRTGWLNSLLKYTEMNLRFEQGEDRSWTQLRLLVDKDEAVSVSVMDSGSLTQLKTSLLPDASYTLPAEKGSVLDLLLGTDAGDSMTYEPDGTEANILNDAYTLLQALCSRYESSFTVKKKTETVNGYGKTTQTWKAVFPDGFDVQPADLCPEGALKRLLSGVTFTGKQTLTLLRTSAGVTHKATWSGSCAWGGVTRKLTLTWKLNHADTEAADHLTLKAESDEKNSLELEWERSLKQDGGRISETDELTWSTVNGEKKTALTVQSTLTRTDGTDGSFTLAGTVTGTRTASNEEKLTLKLSPELTADPAALTLGGMVGVEKKTGDTTQLKASVRVTAAPCDPLSAETWPLPTALDEWTEEQLGALRRQLTDNAAANLTAGWVMLPKNDTMYLSQDMTEDVWQMIAYAAMALTEEEE